MFRSSLAAPLIPYFVSRALIFAVLIFVSQLELSSVPARDGLNYLALTDLAGSKISSALYSILDSADAGWYRGIAENGYDRAAFTTEVAHNWVFFPLYPLLVRGLIAIGIDPVVGGALLSAAAFYAALVLLHAMALKRGISEAAADRTLWLICFFPTSYFFSSPMTEALFLLLVVGTWFALERGKLLAAGSAMFLAGACRPTGLLLLPAFGLRLYKADASFTAKAAAAAIAPAGAILYMLYLHRITGNALAFSDNQFIWGRNQRSLWSLLVELATLQSSLVVPWNFVILNFCALVLGLAAVAALIRRREWDLAILVLLPLGASLATGTLQSMARFVMTLFPIFLVLSGWCERRSAERVVLAFFASLLALMALGYASHFTAAMA